MTDSAAPLAPDSMAARSLVDTFGREIGYLRISITDRCNLRCEYCVPRGGGAFLPRRLILTYEEISDVARAAARLGVRRFRVTGGEPLVRRDVVELTRMLASIPGVEDLALSTNGILLEQYARPLAEAGLRRVNISLDTVDPDRYRASTNGGDLEPVIAGVEAARQAGLRPIKLNCVVEESSDEPDARGVARFAEERGLEARFIRRMSFADGVFWIVEGGSGGDCPRCDRLRLSCDGKVRPCLFSDDWFDVRELGAERALREAVRHKPESGKPCGHEAMRAIGG